MSCPSCGAPLALTYTLASRSDVPRADSLEISRFLPSFLGKMAVFDKTDTKTRRSSANSCRSCMCQSCVELHKELLTRRSCSNRMQMQRTTRTSCLKQEGAAARRSCVASSPHNQFWGSDFPSHMKKLTLLGNVSPLYPPRSRC